MAEPRSSNPSLSNPVGLDQDDEQTPELQTPTPRHRADIKKGDVVHSTLEISSNRAMQMLEEAAMAHSKSLVQRYMLEEVIHEDQQRFFGCLMLVLTMIYFALYTSSALLHWEITNSFLLESPIRDALEPKLLAMNDIDDVWKWLETDVVNTFFNEKGFQNGMANRLNVYNHLEGALRLTQSRSIEEQCTNELAAHMKCHPYGTLSNKPFGRPWSSLSPSDQNEFGSVLKYTDEGFDTRDLLQVPQMQVGASAANSTNTSGRGLRTFRQELEMNLPGKMPTDYTFSFYLFANKSYQDIKTRLRYLRTRDWLDEQTTRMQLRAVVMNAEEARPRLVVIEAELYFSRGGGVFARLYLETMFLRPLESVLIKAVDYSLSFVLIVFTVWTIMRLWISVRSKTTWHHVTQMKNWLAWVNVAITWTYFVFFSVQDEFRDLVVECLQGLSAPGASEHTKQVQAINLHTQTKQWAQFVDWHHTLTTYISLLLMLRVFLALEAQPQLAVVLRTLRATSEDLGHFLIIIVPTFIAYAISGWCLFGRRVPEFSSILRAIGTCFKIAIESEYQWVELSAEDFLTSAIWIWSFILLIVLVMLNMVLAIIMDVYTEVRKSAGDH